MSNAENDSSARSGLSEPTRRYVSFAKAKRDGANIDQGDTPMASETAGGIYARRSAEAAAHGARPGIEPVGSHEVARSPAAPFADRLPNADEVFQRRAAQRCAIVDTKGD